ncbi:MAG: dihydropteroate synthase [Candidatus Marsarchaeota archaeon]|nr:dihydropteroate synthase [Candidatus Marsarchaeota archaeon]
MEPVRKADFSDAAIGRRQGIMAILNVTPDSFSDGGRFFDVGSAIERGHQLAAMGADIIDVGGESSRPGAAPVPLEEELRRVIPVISELSKSYRVSVDTFKPEVASRAVEAGATLVNDISASLAAVAAEYDVGWVAMHMQGSPQTMQRNPHYEDVVGEVFDYLQGKVDWARDLGVKDLWADPGIGFGKNLTHNLALLAGLDQLSKLGVPILVGTSRKAFLGKIAQAATGRPVPPPERTEASVASCAWCFMHGATMMRVHDVAETRELLSLLSWNGSDLTTVSP